MATEPKPLGSVNADGIPGVIKDPSENVKDLVLIEKEHGKEIRELIAAHDRELRAAESQYQNEMRHAEVRRHDALDAQRVRYEDRIAEDLRVGVKTTSDQLAGQLIKETGSLSAQITTQTNSFANQINTLTAAFNNQITSLTAAITPRLADLERFRWEQGGKTSERDPAVSLQLAEITKDIAELHRSGYRSEGSGRGQTQMVGWIFGAVMAAAAAASIFVMLTRH